MKLVVKLVNARGCTSRSGARGQWTTPGPRVCSRGAANNAIGVDIDVVCSVFPNSSTSVASSSCSKRLRSQRKMTQVGTGAP